jgi:hypothetical protein
MNSQRETASSKASISGDLFGLGGGIRLMESPHLVKQWRFPTTKKRRIRKKWAKVKSNWRPDLMCYRMPTGAILCHPIVAARIKAALKPNDQVEARDQ